MTRRGRWILAGVLAVAAALRIVAVLASSPVDDAFITFRYARNLAAGHGFVYNLGERVLGTTTPLFALLLTPFARAGLPLPRVAAGLAILASLATTGLLFLLVRRAIRGAERHREGQAESGGLLAAALYGLFYAQIASCGYGMETQVFECLALAALLAAASDRPAVSGAMAGLAALARPEGFLLALLLGLAALARSRMEGRPIPWRAAAAFGLIVLPWIAFATLYFGSFVPNSALAKASQRKISPGDWARFFVLRNPVIMLAWAAAAAGAAWAWVRRNAALGLVAVWIAVYAIFFLIARPPFLGLWYFPPLAAPLMALVAAGILLVATRIRLVRVEVVVVSSAAVWAALLAVSAPRALQSAKWSRTVAERVYLPMAAWAREHTTPDDVVEVSDIGYVGFYSGRTILDAGGLVSPELWRDYVLHAGDPAKDVHFTLKRRPGVLLLPIDPGVYPRYIAGGLLALYEPVERFQAEGRTELAPGDRPVPGAAQRNRFVPDYIAFRRLAGR